MSKLDITKSEIARFYKDKKILLVGGTGTVGEKMIEVLLKYDPKVIRIFSRDEYKQYLLANKYPKERRLRYLIGDVRDSDRLIRAAKEIDIIFNLAAMKHVPACEYNPFEAVMTNVIGTQNIISAGIACGASKVVLTSSDKAISPTNAMGATKLLGERLMIAADSAKGGVPIAFSAVRFGNVLGSRGSVIPLFLNQIQNGESITITDSSMTRFMMTVSDAVDLTLKAAAISRGGEIFVLKMPNIKITDLAETVIELACEKFGIDSQKIEKLEIGLRAGEKKYEELMTDLETSNSYDLENMYAILPPSSSFDELYAGIPKTALERYSSDQVDIISKKEVRELLIKEQLI